MPRVLIFQSTDHNGEDIFRCVGVRFPFRSSNSCCRICPTGAASPGALGRNWLALSSPCDPALAGGPRAKHTITTNADMVESLRIGFTSKSSLGAGSERRGSSVHRSCRSGPAAPTVEEALTRRILYCWRRSALGSQAARRGFLRIRWEHTTFGKHVHGKGSARVGLRLSPPIARAGHLGANWPREATRD